MATVSMTEPRKMPYARLGESGLKVSKIILGCMSYGSTDWQGWILPEEEGIKHIKFAYENGINAFDTANMYSNGESEIILGKAIKQLHMNRDEIVVLTKVYGVVGRSPSTYIFGGGPEVDAQGYVNQYGLSRKHIFDSVKHSLERLQLDYIDVLQCHRFDYDTPVSETMQALHDVVQAGYVRYIGMSSCHAYQFNEMQTYAIKNNLTPFISMQNHYSLVYREEEREMFPTLRQFGVGSIPWSPLARGVLTHPLKEKTTRTKTDQYLDIYQKYDDIVNRVEEVGRKKGISMAQVAMAWILAKPGVTAPIVGTTSLENLKDLIESVHVKLTDEEMKYLEEAYQSQEISGHW